jgi:hypothetical protein
LKLEILSWQIESSKNGGGGRGGEREGMRGIITWRSRIEDQLQPPPLPSPALDKP